MKRETSGAQTCTSGAVVLLAVPAVLKGRRCWEGLLVKNEYASRT